MNIHFVRRGDGVTYEFRRVADPPHDEPRYRRADAELFCRRLPDFGWCVVDADGQVLSRPFDDAGRGVTP